MEETQFGCQQPIRRAMDDGFLHCSSRLNASFPRRAKGSENDVRHPPPASFATLWALRRFTPIESTARSPTQDLVNLSVDNTKYSRPIGQLKKVYLAYGP